PPAGHLRWELAAVTLHTGPSALCAQVERDEPIVVEQRAEFRTEITTESGIIIQPPERRPTDDEESHARPAQPLQFADRRGVVRGPPPVQPVPLGEGDRPPAGAVAHVPTILIGQDEAGAGRHEGRDLPRRRLETVQPGPGDPLARVGLEPQVSA